jgi:hypothetical protein
MLQAFRGFVFVLCVIPFVGCMKKIEYVDTNSGRPEVTIRKASTLEVLEKLVFAMERKGYQTKQIKAPIVEFAKRSKANGKIQEGRVRFKIMNTALGVKVFASLHRISNPGRSTEKITDISKDSKDARGLQGMLERIKEDLESYTIKSF